MTASAQKYPEYGLLVSEIAQVISAFGVRQCFGVVGSYNFTVTDALIKSGIRFTAARHECGAVVMADVYGRLSGELAVASLHSGPGLTNAATGIAEAAKSGTPLLVLAGDADAGAIHSNFFFEQAEFVRSLGAVSERIHTAETALQDVLRAASRAAHGGQTVVLSMPLNVQNSVLQADTVLPKVPPKSSRAFPDPTMVGIVVDKITRSSRPLILAGRGAVTAGAKKQLTALGDRIGALFATTVRSHGIFSGSPWSLGISGGFSSPAAQELIPQSDLVLVFGAGLTRWTTREGKMFSHDACIVQIDNNRGRLGQRHPVHFPIFADAACAAESLLSELENRGVSTSAGWRSGAIERSIAEGDGLNATYVEASGDDFLDPRTVSRAINDIVPKDRIVVTDAGHFAGWVPQYLKIQGENSWCMPLSFQSIGLGLPAAIGASVSQPDRLVVLAAGDGGFAMSLAELETAVRLKCRICIFIYDDSGYGAEVHHFGRLGYSTQMVEFPDVDFAKIARGHGADGCVVRSLADLGPLREWVDLGARGVFVVDAKINRSLEAQWHRDAFGSHKS